MELYIRNIYKIINFFLIPKNARTEIGMIKNIIYKYKYSLTKEETCCYMRINILLKIHHPKNFFLISRKERKDALLRKDKDTVENAAPENFSSISRKKEC